MTELVAWTVTFRTRDDCTRTEEWERSADTIPPLYLLVLAAKPDLRPFSEAMPPDLEYRTYGLHSRHQTSRLRGEIEYHER